MSLASGVSRWLTAKILRSSNEWRSDAPKVRLPLSSIRRDEAWQRSHLYWSRNFAIRLSLGVFSDSPDRPSRKKLIKRNIDVNRDGAWEWVKRCSCEKKRVYKYRVAEWNSIIKSFVIFYSFKAKSNLIKWVRSTTLFNDSHLVLFSLNRLYDEPCWT